MTDRSVFTGRQGGPAVGRNGDPLDVKHVSFEGGQLLTGLEVPPAYGEVGVRRVRVLPLSPAPREDVAPVGRKCHAGDEVLVPLEAAQLLACLQIKQDHDSARPGHGKLVVGRNRHAVKGIRVSIAAADFLPALQVPQDHESITTTGEAKFSVGRTGHTSYPPRDLSLEAAEFLARR